MGAELNASGFIFNDIIYTREFEVILSKFVSCYQKLRESNKSVPLSNENGIRDILLQDYLKNAIIKKELDLSDYLFDRETSEDISTGRVDIRVMPVNPFESDEAYYIFECKRIDSRACKGTSGLNYKYIKNGIFRFTTNFYSSYYKTNAMIGFVVEPIDIHSNMEDINFLLMNNFKQINPDSLIVKENFIKDFEYHYSSLHQSDNGDNIKLYHLMLSFLN